VDQVDQKVVDRVDQKVVDQDLKVDLAALAVVEDQEDKEVLTVVLVKKKGADQNVHAGPNK